MTTDQRMASKARAFQSVARSHLRSNWNAGSAVVLLGGDASPEIQRSPKQRSPEDGVKLGEAMRSLEFTAY